MRSELYGTIDGGGRIGLVDLLAVYALFDNDPQAINRIEDGFAKVTPALIQKTAQEYLRSTNRSIYVIEPGAKPVPPSPGRQVMKRALSRASLAFTAAVARASRRTISAGAAGR
jgi:hypothetical protein